MENENILQKRSSNPKIAILLFSLIFLFVSFYESKKVILWEKPQSQKYDAFNHVSLAFAKTSEKIKADLGLSSFFQKENLFWSKIKMSPIVFSQLPATSTKEELPEPIQKLKPPYRILIIGDSFIAVYGGVGDTLERTLLAYNDITALRKGVVSSGLSRPDYFDWNSQAKTLISQFNPNIVIIMLGSNDAQSFSVAAADGKNIIFKYGTDEWFREYEHRVSDFLHIFADKNITAFWVGFPIMENKTYSQKMQKLNSIYENEAKKVKNAHFVPLWYLFTDKNGDYTAFLPDQNGKYMSARLSDGIHLSYFGGQIAVNAIIQELKEVISPFPSQKD
ncbi:MAG: DUF459 domain-containing protein [Candidatus Pacebacteria bacterium]|nr:DUF459 domain-containing protein [Candidatus Paceibacterota bacterium]